MLKRFRKRRKNDLTTNQALMSLSVHVVFTDIFSFKNTNFLVPVVNTKGDKIQKTTYHFPVFCVLR